MSEKFKYNDLVELSATVQPRAELAMRKRFTTGLSTNEIRSLVGALTLAIGHAIQCKAIQYVNSPTYYSADPMVGELNRKLDWACGYNSDDSDMQDPR